MMFTETIEQIKARFPKALERVFEVWRTVLPRPYPGECQDNIFDFEDGLRLIISRDQLKHDIPPHIHVSCSIYPNSKLFDKFAVITLDRQCVEITEIVGRRLNLISDKDWNLVFCGLSMPKLVPHWIAEEI